MTAPDERLLDDEAWGALMVAHAARVLVSGTVPSAALRADRAARIEQTEALKAECERLMRACSTQNAEIEQTLGKALGYPWFKDDQINFPGATEASGVCVGDHVAETLAIEAAGRTARLVALLRRGQVALEIVSNDASRAALPKLQWDIIHEAIRDIRRELEARP